MARRKMMLGLHDVHTLSIRSEQGAEDEEVDDFQGVWNAMKCEGGVVVGVHPWDSLIHGKGLDEAKHVCLQLGGAAVCTDRGVENS
eukprot:748031-Hanusia_phi.AAC.2